MSEFEIVPNSRVPMINKTMPPNYEVPQLKDFNDRVYDYEGRFMYRPWASWKEMEIHQEDELAGNWNLGYGTSNGVEICRMFHYGRNCTYGDRCRFLHEIPERIKNGFGLPRQSYEAGMSAGGRLVDQRSGFDQLGQMSIGGCSEISKAVCSKTRFCYHWRSTGRCPYVSCRFAHGEAELQKLGCYSVPEHRGVYNPSATSSATEPGLRSKTGATSSTVEAGLRSKTENGTDNKNMVSRVKRFFKSNEPVKLNGIYADWLED